MASALASAHDSPIAIVFSPGATLFVNGAELGSSSSLSFNGQAEKDGHFVVEGGYGADILTGGDQADTFIYSSAAQSSSTSYDTIKDFNFSLDSFDVPGAPGTITGIDAAILSGTLDSGAGFDSEMTADLSGLLSAQHAVLFTASAGNLAGQTFLIVDLNGVSGYQSGADLVIHLADSSGVISTSDFV